MVGGVYESRLVQPRERVHWRGRAAIRPERMQQRVVQQRVLVRRKFKLLP